MKNLFKYSSLIMLFLFIFSCNPTLKVSELDNQSKYRVIKIKEITIKDNSVHVKSSKGGKHIIDLDKYKVVVRN